MAGPALGTLCRVLVFITSSVVLRSHNHVYSRYKSGSAQDQKFSIYREFSRAPDRQHNCCGDGLLLIDTWCDFMIMTCPRVDPSPRKAGPGGLAAVPGLVGNLILVPGDGAWSRLGGHWTLDTVFSSLEKLLAPGHEKHYFVSSNKIGLLPKRS